MKKETLTQVFSCDFCEIFKNTVFMEHLRMTASDKSFIIILDFRCCYSDCIFFLRHIFKVSLKFLTFFKSSRPDVFCEKGVLKHYAKFKGKHLCLSLLFNKVSGLRHNTIFLEHLWWLLLFIGSVNPANIFLLKFNNRKTGGRCETCGKLKLLIFSLFSTLNIFHIFF